MLGIDRNGGIALGEVSAVRVGVVLGKLLEGFPREVAVAAGIGAVLGEANHLALVVERLDVPATLPPAPLPELVGDLGGVAPVRRVEVDVVGDQELAGADGRGPGGRVELGRPEIGLPFRVRELGLQPLVLPCPHVGQIAPLRHARSVLVQIDRDAELVADALSDLTGDLGAFLHRYP